MPDDWRDAALSLLAPVVDEVDPLIATLFTDGAVGAAAQGWIRQVQPDGLVVPWVWPSPEPLLQSVQALFLSREDIRGQEAAVVEWFQRMPVGVLTADRAGALLFVNGERYEVPPRRASEIDPTGAGDVFAATFLVQYQRDGDPWLAAAAAACAGSLAVEGEGWSAVADRAAPRCRARGVSARTSDHGAGQSGRPLGGWGAPGVRSAGGMSTIFVQSVGPVVPHPETAVVTPTGTFCRWSMKMSPLTAT